MEYTINQELTSKLHENMSYARFMNFQVAHAEPGKVVLAMDYRDDVTQAAKYIHGGAILSLVDQTAGGVASSVAEPGQTFLTTELKINFLRPATCPTILCQGTFIKQGRSQSVVEMRVINPENDKLIAFATATMVPNQHETNK